MSAGKEASAGILALADEIIDGRRLSRSEGLDFFKDCELAPLLEGADRLRRHFAGDYVDLCTIIAGKSGNCGENCAFCAQSAHNHTGCEIHQLLDFDRVYAEAKANEAEGVDRFAIVISGRSPSDADFDRIVRMYSYMHGSLRISLCSSLGFLTSEQFARLYAAGVRSYHNNIETSRSYFKNICSTHSFDDKVANIRRAQAAGLSVCSGGIIGMGETMDDRIEMALDLCELGIRSIPLNMLVPIPGTPLEALAPLPEEEILRTVAMFRYVNPESDIRLGAGRRLLTGNGTTAFRAGASATITGNMLTTSGSTIRSDRAMLLSMGRRLVEA